MPRGARIILPGMPHHVTQRGNRRQPTFFSDGDYRFYLSLVRSECHAAGVSVWAYCLMPNHVHLLLRPSDEAGLGRAVKETHRRYTTMINRREGWTGYLWQGRFGSEPLSDDRAALGAARYIERNPIEAGLVSRPEDWPWSSAAAHLAGRDDPLLDTISLLEIAPNWRAVLD
jgi:putative transposase